MSRKPARTNASQAARTARAEPRAHGPAAPLPPLTPAPAFARDRWAWASLLAMVALLVRSIGAPLGEPVAEDFDFLRRALFHGLGSLFDGGGSTAFWRPLAHQVYYTALGPLVLDHPRAIATLHALLLAAGTLLVYRALRPSLGGVTACVAASFPCFAESTRTLVGWPSQFVDVGLYFFTALALHETSRRRLPSALAAALLALLCKELAVVAVVLLPCFPAERSPRERFRWAGACAALLLAWGATYLAVRHAAHLSLPHHLEQDPALLGTPITARFAWALRGGLRSMASLPLVPDPSDILGGVLGIGLLAATILAAAFFPKVRARLVARRTWLAWGLAWFLGATAALTTIFPLWQPNRTHFGSAGFGVAAAVACEAVQPGLTATLVLGRLLLLVLAPAPPAQITPEAAQTGAFMDFVQLTRLQRFMSETRRLLRADYPRAPSHATLIEMNLPHGLSYALGGDRAVQVWYRDSTLRIANFGALADDSTLVTVAGVQYQPAGASQVVLLSPAAMRAQDDAYRALRAHRWPESVAAVDHADALLPDPRYVVFHGNNAGYRAFAWLQMGRTAEAEQESRRALSLDPTDRNGLLALASALASRGRLDEALVQVDHLLRIDPGQPSARDLRARIVAAQGSPRSP
jgi:tetratricopeptide (TPR) repeat protein